MPTPIRTKVAHPSKRPTMGPARYYVAWLDETDPARHTVGKKIAKSKEEVADVGIPLKVMEAKNVLK